MLRFAGETAQYSPVVQLVNTSACHAEDRGFKSRQGCQYVSSERGTTQSVDARAVRAKSDAGARFFHGASPYSQKRTRYVPNHRESIHLGWHKAFRSARSAFCAYPGRSGAKDCEERVRFRELEGSTPDSAGAISVLFHTRNDAVRRRLRP